MMRRFAFRITVLAILAVQLLPAVSNRMSRFYYLEDTMAHASLESHYGDIGSLSPVWFTVETDGALSSTVDPKLVSWAAARKLPLIPTVANRDFKPEAVQAACSEGVREKLIAALMKIAAENHFAGFELDIEEVPAPLRNTFSSFVGELAGALHKQNMLLGVAIPAPLTPGSAPEIAPPLWVGNPRAGAFDFRQLASVADSLTLMAYDEYTSPAQPGPVAGFAWVEACIRNILQLVPPQKLLLGLALYYRHWSGTKVTEGPFAAARALAAKSALTFALDASHREMTLGFSEGAVKNVLWCEDASNLAARLALVDRHGLLGFAAWRLGQEDPDVWEKVFHQFSGKEVSAK